MDAQSRTSGADLLTTAEVADMVGKTIATVNRWAVNGLLPCAAQANGRLFRRRDVERFIARRDRARQPAAS